MIFAPRDFLTEVVTVVGRIEGIFAPRLRHENHVMPSRWLRLDPFSGLRYGLQNLVGSQPFCYYIFWNLSSLSMVVVDKSSECSLLRWTKLKNNFKKIDFHNPKWSSGLILTFSRNLDFGLTVRSVWARHIMYSKKPSNEFQHIKRL